MVSIVGRAGDTADVPRAPPGTGQGMGMGSMTALARQPAPIAPSESTTARVKAARNPPGCSGPPKATKTIPVTVRAVAAPIESAIDSAEELNPLVSGVDRASVIVPRRG